MIENPRYPYAQLLVASIPGGRKRREAKRQSILGDVPSPLDLPAGCPFQMRCLLAENRCREERPILKPVESWRKGVCHLVSADGVGNDERGQQVFETIPECESSLCWTLFS
ncbi:MAG: hypothetical protein M2R45_00374 [Verrucomicrobia subdivision 3 bacterium]|nr:hypothetical protein [Limisphaerales bacterium]MCS1412868.1 hypothetical protein [Limisphaerales bacterium]